MRHRTNWSEKALPSLVSIVEAMSEHTGIFCSVAILISSIVIVHEAIVRYVLRIPTVWQTEVAIYILIMATFVGAAFTQKHEGHINVDFIISRVSPKVRAIILIAVSMVGFVVCILLARYSWPMWWEATVKWQHSGSLWNPPLIWPYILLPLGMTLLALEYVVYIAKKIMFLRKPSESVKTEEE